MGIVVEERRSELPGGFCYVRINFQDGKIRVFDNNFNSDGCCYYAGVQKIDTEREVRRSKRQEERMKKRLVKLIMQTRKMLKAPKEEDALKKLKAGDLL